jgi:hypothetical protein
MDNLLLPLVRFLLENEYLTKGSLQMTMILVFLLSVIVFIFAYQALDKTASPEVLKRVYQNRVVTRLLSRQSYLKQDFDVDVGRVKRYALLFLFVSVIGVLLSTVTYLIAGNSEKYFAHPPKVLQKTIYVSQGEKVVINERVFFCSKVKTGGKTEIPVFEYAQNSRFAHVANRAIESPLLESIETDSTITWYGKQVLSVLEIKYECLP